MENAASVNSYNRQIVIVKSAINGAGRLKVAPTRQVVSQDHCPTHEVGASAVVPPMVLNQPTLGERGAVLLADDDVIEYTHIDELECVF